MRVFAPLILLFATVAFAAAQESLKGLERVRLFGSDYVRVKEWCNLIGFDARWVRKNEDFRATNRWWKLSFAVDSRRVQANGVNLLLSLPVVARNEVPFISLLDVQTTLHPILYPS